MSHTLHRVGDEDSLRGDIIFTYMPSKNINHVASAPKLRRFLELCREHGAIRIGDTRKGNEYVQGSVENLLENVEDRAVVQAVFDDPAAAVRALIAVKEADLGLSLVISGLFDQTRECCSKAGTKMHTVNESLGRWGKVDRLPGQKVIELNTMCGHGMVSAALIEAAIEKVKKGKWKPERAAEELYKCCICSIFNTARAEQIFSSLIE
jgi:hypothetical protein